MNHDLLKENEKRKIQPPYDPISGEGAWGKRYRVKISEIGTLFLPDSFIKVGWIRNLIRCGSFDKYIKKYKLEEYEQDIKIQFVKERFKHDCEYWMATFALIKIKSKPKDDVLIPSKTQREVLYPILEDWFAQRPVRFIVVKCRQAFITTIVTAFNTWVQMCVFEQWNSLVCGDVENQATNIRGVQDKIIKNIPAVFTKGNVKYDILPFEGSNKTRIITERNCKISTGSMQRPENVRAADNSSSHCTEVGLWKTTLGKTPEDLIQAIRGGMDDVAYTVFGLESSPKGTGNYFYEQWQAAKQGKSDLRPIFLPWFFVERYSKEITNWDEFWDVYYKGKDSEYLQYLWYAGATLEQINWYIGKLKTMEHWRVQSEFPSNDIEAFQSTGKRVFPMPHVDRMRKMCTEPIFVGDLQADGDSKLDALTNIRLVKVNKSFKVWVHPDKDEKVSNRYVVVVDIGGTSETADYSDILVFDRYEMMFGGNPEVVAEWHDHTAHDILAWRSAQIAKYYNDALLVIESNTLETEHTEGDHSEYILSEIKDYYSNLYSRTPEDKIKEGKPRMYGFHTNTKTKPLVVANMKKCLRDVLYYEKNDTACVEMDVFELKDDGTYGAADKCHDDMVMTRAIGLHICYKDMPLPEVVKQSEYKAKKIVGMSSM